jgi:hypothetical protein
MPLEVDYISIGSEESSESPIIRGKGGTLYLKLFYVCYIWLLKSNLSYFRLINFIATLYCGVRSVRGERIVWMEPPRQISN